MTPEEMASDEIKKLREKFIKDSINDAQLVCINLIFLTLAHFITVLFRQRFKVHKRNCLNVENARRKIVHITNYKHDLRTSL